MKKASPSNGGDIRASTNRLTEAKKSVSWLSFCPEIEKRKKY
ncbi:hypothetical protein [Eubacterium barkeri]|nr:hypothetical protein [Eubacterium barkeri]